MGAEGLDEDLEVVGVGCEGFLARDDDLFFLGVEPEVGVLSSAISRGDLDGRDVRRVDDGKVNRGWTYTLADAAVTLDSFGLLT